jgi:two-component system, sensor histidine kinase RegB
MEKVYTRYSASLSNLRSLLIIRSLVIVGQLLLLWYLADKDIVSGAYQGLQFTIAALAGLTLLSFVRLTLGWPITDAEYFAQLIVDVAGLSMILYFSGGANNPFVSYYLIPVVISAAVLSRGFTWVIALLSLAAYSSLLFYHVPLPLFSPQHHGTTSSINIHVLGMWVNFLLSVALITWFVVGMAAALRRQEQSQGEEREDQLRNEQIMAVAGLAAGTAHELGTPLTTMSVLLEDLQEKDHGNRDLEVLQEQLERCKSILDKLSKTARLTDIGETRRVDSADYLALVFEQWQLLRPEATATLMISGRGQSPMIDVELTLGQAIENILNNAANAWPKDIEVELDWSNTELTISISDNGPGIPAKTMQQIGKPIIREDGRGMGLGLLLSHATINRYRGRIELTNRRRGGTLAQLFLPLTRK